MDNEALESLEGKVFEGWVKWFSVSRGYGFVVGKESGTEFFFHFTAIQSPGAIRGVEKNEEVTFEVGRNKHGLCAVKVWQKSLRGWEDFKKALEVSKEGGVQ